MVKVSNQSPYRLISLSPYLIISSSALGKEHRIAEKADRDALKKAENDAKEASERAEREEVRNGGRNWRSCYMLHVDSKSLQWLYIAFYCIFRPRGLVGLPWRRERGRRENAKRGACKLSNSVKTRHATAD